MARPEPRSEQAAPGAGPPSLWTRAFVLAVAATTAMFAGYYLILPALPLFAHHLGASKATVGWVITVYSLAATVARLLVSPRMDRSGRRVYLLAGLAAFTACALAYPAVTGLTTLLSLRVLHGIAWGLATTAFAAVVADLSPASRRGEGMGSWGLAPTVAMAVGPLLGEGLLASDGFAAAFLGCAVGGAAALLVAVPIGETVPSVRPVSTVPRPARVPRGALLPAVALFVSSLAYGALVSFLPVEMAERGGGTGLFFTVYAFAILASRPFAGALSDRLGRRAVVVPGLALGGVGTVILGASPAGVWLVVAALLIGLGIGGASFPGLMALAVDRSPADARGGAMAAFFTAYDLAIAFGAALLGPLYGALGFFAMNLVAAAGILLAIPLIWRLA
jgi:MFS family permease